MQARIKVGLFYLLMCMTGAAAFCATGDDFLNVYSQITGKTILAGSNLRISPEFKKLELSEEKTNALESIEKELSRSHIVVVDDGLHFVRLVPQESSSFFLTNLPLRGAQLAARAERAGNRPTNASANEIIPPGVINFFGVDTVDAVNIYEELTQVTVLRPYELPSARIRFRNQTALSKEETIYALETVLGFNGVGVKHDGAKLVLIGALPEILSFKNQAPLPDSAAKLLDPEEVLSVGSPKPYRPMTKVEEDLEKLRKAFYEFIHPPRPRDQSVQRLFEFYAQLRDKKAEPSNYFESMPVKFRVRTPMTREELIYAIETTFALNSVVVTDVDAETLGLKDKAEKTRQIYKPKIQQLYPPPKR